MTFDDFIQSKIAFIHEFMNSTRPSSELEDFIKAFDSINLNVCDCPDPTPAKDFQLISSEEHTVEPVQEEEPIKRRRKKTRKIITIHDGTKFNVHPAAKLVKVSFFDRDSYYGSITAAAQALGVTPASVTKAIKKRHRVNGHDVEFASLSEFTKEYKSE